MNQQGKHLDAWILIHEYDGVLRERDNSMRGSERRKIEPRGSGIWGEPQSVGPRASAVGRESGHLMTLRPR